MRIAIVPKWTSLKIPLEIAQLGVGGVHPANNHLVGERKENVLQARKVLHS